jgi:uncharacterized protein with GYD domain
MGDKPAFEVITNVAAIVKDLFENRQDIGYLKFTSHGDSRTRAYRKVLNRFGIEFKEQSLSPGQTEFMARNPYYEEVQDETE